MEQLNKDFYDKLPSFVCEQLDRTIIPQLEGRKWFNKFWSEYSEHVNSVDMDDMQTPGAYLKKYINLDTKEDL